MGGPCDLGLVMFLLSSKSRFYIAQIQLRPQLHLLVRMLHGVPQPSPPLLQACLHISIV